MPREDGEREGERSSRYLGAERISARVGEMVRLEEWLRTASARMEPAPLVILHRSIPARIVPV